MPHYELLYIVLPKFSEDEVPKVASKVKEQIQKFGGKITLEDNLGKKKLAYPIKHNRYGYYLLLEFDLEAEKVKSLDNNLKLLNEVLRHQMVKKRKEIPHIPRPKKIKEPLEKKEKKEIKIEDLDKKLDEILKEDII